MANTCIEETSNNNCLFSNGGTGTNIVVNTLERYIKANATTLRIQRPTVTKNGAQEEIPIPCKGYIQIGECCCDSEDFEIAYYDGVDESTANEYKLLNLVRNLPKTGTSIVSIGAPKEHSSSTKIIIAPTTIHYYHQVLANALCNYVSLSRTVYLSVGQLPAPTNSGQFAFVKSGNSVLVYVDSNVNGTATWLGQSLALQTAGVGQQGVVSLKQAGTNVVYNVGSTPTALDVFYNNSSACGTNTISSSLGLVPQYGSYVVEDIAKSIAIGTLVSNATPAQLLLLTYSVNTPIKTYPIIKFAVMRSKTNTELGYRVDILDDGGSLVQSILLTGCKTEQHVRDYLMAKGNSVEGNYTVQIYAVYSSLLGGTVTIDEVNLDILIQPIC